jgi:hypothetical protein
MTRGATGDVFGLVIQNIVTHCWFSHHCVHDKLAHGARDHWNSSTCAGSIIEMQSYTGKSV